MATIKQHIPGFVSGYDPVTAKFETLNDLLNIDFVKRWAKDREEWTDAFYQISMDENYGVIYLMAELSGGFKWYVVGYITGIDKNDLGLPQWKAKKGDK